jgi:hypothetical protein
MNYDQLVQAAFIDELQKIADANGGELPGLEKVAGFLSAAMTKLRPAAQSAEQAAMRKSPGIFQSMGQSMMEGGKGLMSPKLVGAGKWAPAGPVSRTVGEVAHSVGHHYANKSTFGNLINPFGGALGGTAEGLTRAAGRELHGAGTNIAGRTGRAMQATGTGLQRSAKNVGRVGEVAGLAGIGGAFHTPVSLAGMVGHHIAGGAAAAAPAIGEAIHGFGDTAAHAAHDVLGNAAHVAANKTRMAAGRGLARLRPQQQMLGAA